MIKQLSRYISVGVINTLIHWLTFAVIWYGTASSQGLSNLVAFCVAVTFSFFANCRFTFNSHATLHRYLIYVAFLGSLSLAIGILADNLHLPPLFTLVTFSASSLFLGFIYSRYIVFKEIK